MRDLQRDLRDLAGAIAVPAAPEQRRLVLALAIVLVVAVVAGLAVSPARTAILRFFGIGAVQVELVDRLPAVEPDVPLALGREIELSEAPFRILRPELLGEPDAVYASGNVVTLLYGSPDRVRLLVTEIGYSALSPEVAKKLVVGTTAARFVEVAGSPGFALWIEGEPHVVDLPGAPARLAGNTLIWVRDGRTLRLEGAEELDDALAIAASMR